MPTPQQIADELVDAASPLFAAYAPHLLSGNDQAVADILNDKKRGYTAVCPMRISTFTQWLMGRALLRKLKEAEADPLKPAIVRNICYGLLLLIQGASDREINPQDQQTASMMSALVSADVCAQADVDDLLAKCAQPASRAEIKWGPGTVVTHGDVARARGRG